jgi:acylphosphatase
MTDRHERVEAVARGVVQGVGFRWYVVRQASRLRLTGWVANESDGSVHVVAEGPADALAELEAALRRGPSGAQVHELDVSRGQASGGFARFEVRASGHRGD